MVKKTILEKYWLVNVVVKLNGVIVQNANLFLSANKFSKKFTECTILFLIDFFSDYN